MKVLGGEVGGSELEFSPAVDQLASDLRFLGFDDAVVEQPADLVDERVHLDVERLVAVEAAVLGPRRRVATPRTVHGRRRRRLVRLVDLLAVGGRNLAVRRLREHRHVPGRHPTPSRPPVMLLEHGLIHALGRQVGRRTLPEVRQCDGLLDARLFGRVLERLLKHVVLQRLGVMQVRPEERVRLLGRRMILQPPLEVGHGRDERDRPLARLPVDRDLHAAVMVGDVPDFKVAKLAAAGARVPRDSDHRLVATVAGGVDHRLDVRLPVEHIRRLRRRLVIPAGAPAHPRDAIGNLVAIRHHLREHAERPPIVAVRLLVIVVVVNPADEVLGCLTVIERVHEAALALGHDGAPADEVLATLVAVLARTQREAVVEREENLAVGLAQLVAILDTIEQATDSLFDVLRHPSRNTSGRDLVSRSKSGPTQYSQTLNLASTPASAGGSQGGVAA